MSFFNKKPNILVTQEGKFEPYYYKKPNILAMQEGISKPFLMQSKIQSNLTSVKTVDNQVITNNVGEYLKRIPTNVFSYTGAYPYLFDFICNICTNEKKNVNGLEDDNKTHYSISEVPFTEFIRIVLKDYKTQKKDFITELKKLAKDKPYNYIYLYDYIDSIKTNQHLIYAQTLIITLKTRPKEKTPRLARLKNIGNSALEDIEIITIEFFKPLWKDLFRKGDPNKWFPCPLDFNCKRKKTISNIKKALKNPNSKNRYIKVLKDIDYNNLLGNYTNPTAGASMYSYLNLHDNKTYETLYPDITEMALYCASSLVLEIRGDQIKLRSRKNTIKYIIKDLILIYCMAIDGFMGGTRLVPVGIFLDKLWKYKSQNGKSKKNLILITINRDLKNIDSTFKINAQEYHPKQKTPLTKIEKSKNNGESLSPLVPP